MRPTNGVREWESKRVGGSRGTSSGALIFVLSHSVTIFFAVTLSLFHTPTALLAQQESPAQWLARIFDPSELGIQQFPGATLNRKLSVDAIQLERGGNKRIGMSLIPPDQLERAAAFFEKQFGVAPQVTGEKTQYVAYAFDFTSGEKGAAKLKGLKVTITRSPFVDNKGQITMEYSPPANK